MCAPSTDFYDFHDVHVSVQIPSTLEVSLIGLNSVSVFHTYDQNGDAWNTRADLENGEVNWQGAHFLIPKHLDENYFHQPNRARYYESHEKKGEEI